MASTKQCTFRTGHSFLLQLIMNSAAGCLRHEATKAFRKQKGASERKHRGAELETSAIGAGNLYTPPGYTQ